MKKVRPKVSLDNEKIRYADIEVRYNEEREEFLFLEKVQDGKYLVDAINKGKIEIEYYSNDDLDRILALFKAIQR